MCFNGNEQLGTGRHGFAAITTTDLGYQSRAHDEEIAHTAALGSGQAISTLRLPAGAVSAPGRLATLPLPS